MPNALEKAAFGISAFIEGQATAWRIDALDVFWHMWRQIEAVARNEPIHQASASSGWLEIGLNHPLGKLIEAAGSIARRQKGISPEARAALSSVLDGRPGVGVSAAKAMLGAYTALFYALDRSWTESNILRLFSWSEEPKPYVAWQGFLHSPHWSVPLFVALKSNLFEAIANPSDLAPCLEELGEAIVAASIEREDLLTLEEVQLAFRAMPPRAREGAALWVHAHQDRAPKEQRAELWERTIGPWLKAHWPQTQESHSSLASEQLCLGALAAEDAFPNAAQLLMGMLAPPTEGWFLLVELAETDLPERFPSDCAKFAKWISEVTGTTPPLAGLVTRIIEQHGAHPTPEMQYLAHLSLGALP
jgi:hypothetical protein